MTPQTPINPQLLAILEEVARDPRSQVLRIPKTHIPVKAEAPVRDREALLTQAEQQLVKLHRYEVADLLLGEVRRAVIEGEDAAGRRLKYESNDVVSEVPVPSEWESRARYRLEAVPGDFDDRAALLLLRDCVRTTPGERPSPVQLALASLRLLPQPRTRVCLGLALYQEGQTVSALETLWDVLAADPCELIRSYAWQNIAEFEWSLNGYSQKDLEALRFASSGPCKRGDPAMSWFAEALRRLDRNESLRAALALSEVTPIGHVSIEKFIQARTGIRIASGVRPSPSQANFFASIENQLPEQAQRIGYALSASRDE